MPGVAVHEFRRAIAACFRKYAVFQGRAPRSEFWWWALFQTVIGLVFLSLDMPYYSQCAVQLLSSGTWPTPDAAQTIVDRLSDLFDLVTLLPTITVTVRRLHDIGKSGWWFWFGFVPLAGQILLLLWNARHGTRGPNRFGPDPLQGLQALN